MARESKNKKNFFSMTSIVLLTDIPVENLSYVYSFLPLQQLFSLALVNRDFYNAFRNPHCWREICLRFIGGLDAEKVSGALLEQHTTWMNVFRHLDEMYSFLPSKNAILSVFFKAAFLPLIRYIYIGDEAKYCESAEQDSKSGYAYPTTIGAESASFF